MMTSPAFAVMVVYVVLIQGIDRSVAEEGLDGVFNRASWASTLTIIAALFMGLATFVSAHLVATSARRAGTSAQLDAAPMSLRRRDLALCLAVAIGPAFTALLLTLTSAWLASGLPGPYVDSPGANDWAISDGVQIPAVVLGAGILAIVVARWLPFPGSLLVGFLGMCQFTGWLASATPPSLKPWFAWFPVIPWLSDLDPESAPNTAMAWHSVYLLAWCAVGVCAVALRPRDGRGPWLAALGTAVALLAVAAIAQVAVLPTT